MAFVFFGGAVVVNIFWGSGENELGGCMSLELKLFDALFAASLSFCEFRNVASMIARL